MPLVKSQNRKHSVALKVDISYHYGTSCRILGNEQAEAEPSSATKEA